VIGWEKRPFAPIGGCRWMIVDRSSRTMMRCTPVCGPAPLLYCVSGSPDGWRMKNEILSDFPGTTRAGVKPAISNVRAGWIVGVVGRALDPDPPQPAATSATASAPSAPIPSVALIVLEEKGNGCAAARSR
jgi:hypothetical protein